MKKLNTEALFFVSKDGCKDNLHGFKKSMDVSECRWSMFTRCTQLTAIFCWFDMLLIAGALVLV